LLAAAGGFGGVLLSRVFIGVLSTMFFSLDDEGHPLSYDFSQTTTIVVATFGAALAAGVVFSLIPALKAVGRAGAHPATTRTVTSRWSGRLLLSAQAAVAVAMVATATLLTASAHIVLAGRNYDTSHVALMRVRPRLVKYTPDRALPFQREVVRRLRAIPSVESVTMVGIGSILSGGSAKVGLPASTDASMTVRYNEIGPAYFSTLRTPVVAGREFDDRDTIRSPRVAVINETLAARLWPPGRALGATLLVGDIAHQVVGIVADVSIQTRNAAGDAWIYVPFWQNPGQIDSRIAVRVAGDPAAILPTLAREVHAVDPDVPIAETITLPSRMAGVMRPVLVGAVFVGYAASFALLLTAIGLYGAVAFSVSRRTKEIGIRLALGATRSGVVASIVREGVSVIFAGAAVGVVLGIAQARVVAHLLYGSAASDWLVYLMSALLIVSVGATASLVPARRAAAVEPIVALRQE
jgi:predicted permease